ncbi:MoxR family ATPase [Nonomuraea sp. B19D2]|uniref:AAA family ATPase n=1 Tax=Nonomuraea sp. B19D2 TaxID=3159561 RepID=UPI0032DAAAA1
MTDIPHPDGMAVSDAFESVTDVVEKFAAHGYIADRRMATTVYLLFRLGKPVLLEGPAGVGKTELAKVLAAVTGRRLLRLQCYEGQDESRALYEWDYGKQLLYTQLLREKISEIVADAPDLAAAVERIGDQDSVFFSDRFLSPRPVLEAIRSPEPTVLLIDEIDRADEALEAVLLECLDEYQVSVPEIGTFIASTPPCVVLTSNNTRDLSAALKRRCLHMFLDYPDAERELEIVRSKHTGLPDALAVQLVGVVRELRGLRLRKSPGISETIDWARALAVLGAEDLDAHLLMETANVVLKYERDLNRALEVLPRLVPGCQGGTTSPAHTGHGHGHVQRPIPGGGDSAFDHASLGDEPDGRAVRAAMDQLGRHEIGYRLPSSLSATESSGNGAVGHPGHEHGGNGQSGNGAGQGQRAFSAARRRRAR